MDSVVEFKDNDEKYFKWLSQHPSAYVINTRRVIDAEYMVLHKSTCFHISTYSKRWVIFKGVFSLSSPYLQKHHRLCAMNLSSALAKFCRSF